MNKAQYDILRAPLSASLRPLQEEASVDRLEFNTRSERRAVAIADVMRRKQEATAAFDAAIAEATRQKIEASHSFEVAIAVLRAEQTRDAEEHAARVVARRPAMVAIERELAELRATRALGIAEEQEDRVEVIDLVAPLYLLLAPVVKGTPEGDKLLTILDERKRRRAEKAAVRIHDAAE